MIQREDLKQIVLLSYLTDPMLDEIIPIIDLLQFGNQEIIFKQGDPADRFYMLKRGKVLLEQRITENVTAIIGSIKPGLSFGWGAMIEDGAYSAKAVCAEPCEIYSFKSKKIKMLFEDNPDMGYRVYQRLLVILKKRYDTRTDQFRKAIEQHPDMKDLF
jgi:CRP-like cAMP-binding protein